MITSYIYFVKLAALGIHAKLRDPSRFFDTFFFFFFFFLFIVLAAISVT